MRSSKTGSKKQSLDRIMTVLYGHIKVITISEAEMGVDWGEFRQLARGAVATGRQLPLRMRLFLRLGLAAFAVSLAAGLWWLLTQAGTVTTDNAYVGADVAQITPEIGGTVKAVMASDTQLVRRGEVLVTLEPADAELSLAQAEAEHGRAGRRVQQYLANVEAAAAQVAAQNAELQRSKSEYERRVKLAAKGTISPEELTTASAAHEKARAGLAAAQGALAAAQALVQGAAPDANPEVLAAKAALDIARLNLQRTVIRAPVDGVVARRQVQVGQRVGTGAPLMTIVPVGDLYVDANFKEGQLKKVRAGQRVLLTSDLYGPDIVFHGRVVGLGGGTGAAFAIIPAQNATGNWIKVVQRLPVRIALDPAELEAHPLRVGLSMTVKVDVRQ